MWERERDLIWLIGIPSRLATSSTCNPCSLALQKRMTLTTLKGAAVTVLSQEFSLPKTILLNEKGRQKATVLPNMVWQEYIMATNNRGKMTSHSVNRRHRWWRNYINWSPLEWILHLTFVVVGPWAGASPASKRTLVVELKKKNDHLNVSMVIQYRYQKVRRQWSFNKFIFIFRHAILLWYPYRSR